MAKVQDENEARAGKRRREVPPTVVEPPADDSSDDDGVMKDEFEGLSNVDSDESDSVFQSESSEDEMGDGGMAKRFIEQVTANPKMLEMGYTTSEGDSMEGSRSRSEEDLRDIGSARRLDDDDTADSAWKETAAPEVGDPGPSSSSAPEVEEKSDEPASGSGGDDVAVARVLDDGENINAEEADAMETEEEEEDEEEEDEGDEEGEDEGEDEEDDERVGGDVSESEGEPSASEGGSDSDRGSGGKDDTTNSSAYSRAFSKILQSKAAKESETVRNTSRNGFRAFCVSSLTLAWPSFAIGRA